MMEGFFVADFIALFYGLMDSIIQAVTSSAMLEQWGFGRNPFVGVVTIFLFGAMAFNILEGMVFWLRNQEIPIHNLKKAALAVFWAVAAHSAMTFAEGGTVLGVSSGILVADVSQQSQTQTMKALKAVDVVGKWNKALKDARDRRDLKILAELAKQDANVAKAYQDKLNEYKGGTGGVPEQSRWKAFWTKAKQAYTFLKDMTNYATTRGMQNTAVDIISAVASQLTALVVNYGLLLATFAFSVGTLKVLLLYGVFVKMAVMLASVFVPAAVGMFYFESLRHFGITIIKHIVVLTIMGTMLGSFVTTVFSDKNIEYVIAYSLKDDLKQSVTQEDVLLFKARVSAQALVGTNSGDSTLGYMGVDPSDVMRSSRAAMICLMMMGIMVSTLKYLYEIVTSLFEGGWDPLKSGGTENKALQG